MIAARRKIHLADRQRYERYVRALEPVCWLPMRERSATIARNRAYDGTISAELLANPAFSAWTGDNPDGWTIVESAPNSQVTQNPAGFARFASDGTSLAARQTVFTVGDTVILQADSAAAVSGSVSIGFLGGNENVLVVNGTGQYRAAAIANNAIYNIKRTAACDITLDSVSARKVGQLDGAIAGTTTLGQDGLNESGEAFLFNGATSLITLYNRASIQGLTALTVWALFKPSSAGEGNAGTLFSKAGEFELRFNSASRDLIATVNYSSTNAQRVTSTTLSTNQWHTVGMRIDDSGKLPDIFVDGVEASYASSTTGVGTRASTTNNLIIGNNAAVSQTFAGLLDEALLTDQSLTASELRLLHRLAGLD